jgi:cytochrome c5
MRYWLVCATLILLLGCNRQDAPSALSLPASPPKPTAAPEGAPQTVADPLENLARGEENYRSSCASCHDTGAGGTPKIGDIATWKPRIALGLDTLVHHAIEGYGSSACAMPPRGGHPELHIEAVALAVRYMIEMSLPEEERRLPGPQ